MCAEVRQRRLETQAPSTKSAEKDSRRLNSAKSSKTATGKGKYDGFEVEEAVNAGPGQRQLAKSTKSNASQKKDPIRRLGKSGKNASGCPTNQPSRAHQLCKRGLRQSREINGVKRT
eukprot:scaffold3456_cov78-Skeletonema_dohrnii-CCMP3373.AAC.11